MPRSSAPESPVVVDFRDVSTRFTHEAVLKGVTFSIRRGEFVCLLGPSGCGKSTTLRIMGDLLRNYSGHVEVDGLRPERAWSRLAYVFQTPRLAPWRTALDNILLGMELRGGIASAAARQERAHHWLRMVGLEHDHDKYPAVLSGGEKQRVSIARALALDPDIVLMDEPLSALDVATKQRLREEIQALWQATGKTMVYVTHDLDEALYLADSILLFSAKPTRIVRTFQLDSTRPRSVDDDQRLQSIRREIRDLLGVSEA